MISTIGINPVINQSEILPLFPNRYVNSIWQTGISPAIFTDEDWKLHLSWSYESLL